MSILFRPLSGVLDGGGNTLIGGVEAGARNVISGNTQHGLAMNGVSADVLGKYIGTDVTGSAACPTR